MPTSVNDILVQALPRSGRNRPDAIATAATELRLVVARSLRALFVVGARKNPAYFSDTLNVTGVSGIFIRPPDAEAVWLIETAGGVACVVVPYAERMEVWGKPRLYRMNRNYRTVGGAGDPAANAVLTFTYVRRAYEPPTLSDPIDSYFPEQFVPLLVEEVALYLALKDGRDAEAQQLRPERDAWLALYLAHLEHETMNEERVYHPPRFTDLPTVPLAGLLPTHGG